MEPVIQIENLTVDYGKERGIFDFNMQVQKGEVYGLVGVNGSGKTTTIRNLMGFIHSDKGTATINGMDCYKEAGNIKKCVGYVPGQIDFPDVGSGLSFLKLQAELLGMKEYDYMDSLIDRFKIDVSAPLRRMSKGMKQKMALVAGFMSKPDILLLDEPSTGLDPVMRDAMIELILEQKEEGKTVFMSSHIFKELEDTCDKVTFIHNGKMLETIEVGMFGDDPKRLYEITFKDWENYMKFINSTYAKKNRPVTNYEYQNETERRIATYIEKKQINELFGELGKYNIQKISNPAITLEKYYINHIEQREELSC